MTELDGTSEDLVQDNIQALTRLFPEVACDGKIDFHKLRNMLGDAVDNASDRYNFTWHGKDAALRLSQTPSLGTLRPCKEQSKDWDTTQNLYIEGDNLEVLKLLQKSYHGRVKMIFIDPPYNRGDDLIYRDDYQDNLGNYLRMTGQTDEEGKAYTTNSETNGRYHTDWLNMIYPRLRLARNLLQENGLIFMSIDDHEEVNLKKVCDEVFGEDNFMACFLWQKKTSPDARMDVSAAHDYVLCYAKNKPEKKYLFNALKYEEERLSNYKNPDNDPRGPWASVDITGQTGRAPESQFYEITTPSGKKYYPPEGRCWAMAKDTFKSLYKDNRLWFGENGDNRPRQKKFLNESEGQRPWTWWDNKFASYNQVSNKELMNIFDGKLVFDNPKPTQLIGKMLELATSKDTNDIVLDFFSGSCTTADAVMKLNQEDAGNRRYICVQIPEKLKDTGNAHKANNVALSMGYKTICDIAKERIRRVGKSIKDNCAGGADTLDVGFRVFRLDTSNLKKWQPPTEAENLEQTLMDAVSNILPGRTEEDLLYEIILKMGFDLSWPIETRTVADTQVFVVADGALFICLADRITPTVAEGMAQLHREMKPEVWKVVCRDTGFRDDAAKVNVREILKAEGLDDAAFVTV